MRSKEINKNDMIIAFSGSINSKNIINAINYAKEFSVFTSCISGRDGKLKDISDLSGLLKDHQTFLGKLEKTTIIFI